MMESEITIKVAVPSGATAKDIRHVQRMLNARAERWARGIESRRPDDGMCKVVPKCCECRLFTPYVGIFDNGVQMGGCGEWCTSVRADWGCDGGAFKPKGVAQ